MPENGHVLLQVRDGDEVDEVNDVNEDSIDGWLMYTSTPARAWEIGLDRGYCQWGWEITRV